MTEQYTQPILQGMYDFYKPIQDKVGMGIDYAQQEGKNMYRDFKKIFPPYEKRYGNPEMEQLMQDPSFVEFMNWPDNRGRTYQELIQMWKAAISPPQSQAGQ